MIRQISRTYTCCILNVARPKPSTLKFVHAQRLRNLVIKHETKIPFVENQLIKFFLSGFLYLINFISVIFVVNLFLSPFCICCSCWFPASDWMLLCWVYEDEYVDIDQVVKLYITDVKEEIFSAYEIIICTIH